MAPAFSSAKPISNQRFFFGKISERSLAASVKKTNKELQRLDKGIRDAMSRARALCEKIKSLIAKQAPIGYKARLSGISGGGVKPKKFKRPKKKAKKKKAKKKKAKKKVKKKKAKKKAAKKKKPKKKAKKKKKRR